LQALHLVNPIDMPDLSCNYNVQKNITWRCKFKVFVPSNATIFSCCILT
jgi:hypothetical protein